MNKYVLLACAMVTIAGCAKKASHVAQEQSSVGKEIGTRSTASRTAKEIGIAAPRVPAPTATVADDEHHNATTQEQAAITIAHTEVQELDLDLDNDTETESESSSSESTVTQQKDIA